MRDPPMRNASMRQWSMGEACLEMAYERDTHIRDARL